MSAEAVSLEAFRAEVDAISEIYRLRFPGHRIRLILSLADTPIRGRAWVEREGAKLPKAAPGTVPLGEVVFGAEEASAPEVTVHVDIPRAPTAAEETPDGEVWRPRGRLGGLFRLWPMGYETLRYRLERRRMTKAMAPDHWSMIQEDPTPPDQTQTLALDPEKRPAILVGFHWLEVGGAEKLAFDCVRWAHEAGLRVFVVASVPELQRLADRLPQHEDVTFIRLDRYLDHEHWAGYLTNLVASENIRLVHIHHCTPLYTSLPRLRATAPWLQVIDSTHITEYGGGGFPRISGVWSRYVDVHHVISGQLVDFYRDRFGVTDKVILGRMLDGPDGPEPLPAMTLDPATGELSVCFVGRLYYQKRPLVVVQILRGLAKWAAQKGVRLRVTLVGDGPFRPAMQDLIARYGLSDLVEMKAGSTDVPALLRDSDILLLPSNNEGLALVCYEAIEQGCIPISTDVGSQAEIVPPDLLVGLGPAQAVTDTVAAVERLWSDPAFRAQQEQQLQDKYRNLAADPTARDVLMPLYHAAVKGSGAST